MLGDAMFVRCTLFLASCACVVASLLREPIVPPPGELVQDAARIPADRTLLESSAAIRVPVYGRFAESGVYYGLVSVGFPGQPLAVILDTGSAGLAFTCMGCTDCGSHTHVFNQSASSTLSYVSCDAADAGCQSCESRTVEVWSEAGQLEEQTTDMCLFNRKFAEGSSVEGVYVKDRVAIHNPLDAGLQSLSHATQAQFGCLTAENGQFRTQSVADGVLGLSQGKLSLLHALHSDGVMPSNVFSLCLSDEGGVLTLGGSHEDLHTGPVASTAMAVTATNGWYLVGISKLRFRDAASGNGTVSGWRRTEPAGHAELRSAARPPVLSSPETEEEAGEEEPTSTSTTSSSSLDVAGKGRLLGSAAGLIGGIGRRRVPRKTSVDPSSVAPDTWYSPGLDPMGSAFVVDSGSSFSYVPAAVVDTIVAGVFHLCSPTNIHTAAGDVLYSSKCKMTVVAQQDMPQGQHTCFRMDTDMSYDLFPVFDWAASDGALLTLTARQYLAEMTWTLPYSCTMLFSNDYTAGKNIIGANLMKYRDVTFDIDAKTLYWAPAACPLQVGRSISGVARYGSLDGDVERTGVVAVVAEGGLASLFFAGIMFGGLLISCGYIGLQVYKKLKVTRQRTYSPLSTVVTEMGEVGGGGRGRKTGEDSIVRRVSNRAMPSDDDHVHDASLPDDMEDFRGNSSAISMRSPAMRRGNNPVGGSTTTT